MPEFAITRHIEAPVESVWEVLNDFGDIQRWSDGVTGSDLTSQGPVRRIDSALRLRSIWRRQRAHRSV